jgi:hypothetical protein
MREYLAEELDIGNIGTLFDIASEQGWAPTTARADMLNSGRDKMDRLT